MTQKSVIQGLLTWLKTCPVIDLVDVSQTQVGQEGLYKQATIETEKFLDGTERRTEHWYVLFMKPSKLKKNRISDAEVLEQFENWITEKELSEDYPDIGYTVTDVDISNGYYMMEREADTVVYQATLTLSYIRD